MSDRRGDVAKMIHDAEQATGRTWGVARAKLADGRTIAARNQLIRDLTAWSHQDGSYCPRCGRPTPCTRKDRAH